LNNRYNTLMSIPSPCGLSISSVTSDGQYLYALQPDRRTVYKLDVCARVICVFKTTRKFLSIYYCGGRFYAVAESERTRIYLLSPCFNEQGYIEISFPQNITQTCCQGAFCNSPSTELIFIGPVGNCNDSDCMLAVANLAYSYIASDRGRIISQLSNAGQNLYYTAIAENSGILYEGLESTVSSQTFIRATLLSTGQTKVQRLPFGYRVRGFFCYGGVLYAFITKNGFHAYVAAICTFVSSGILGGEILSLGESPNDTSCCEESCNFGPCNSKCNCTSAGCTSCSGVSSNQTEMCNNAVSGDSTENTDCNIDELCRIFNCIKNLCENSNCKNNNTVSGCNTNGNCCETGNLNCTCFSQCCCSDNAVSGDNCLPLPVCPPFVPCEPSVQNNNCNCSNQ